MFYNIEYEIFGYIYVFKVKIKFKYCNMKI